MRPFEGLRVVDLTHVLAGPFCTYQLAILGADVVKIEEPGLGEYMRRRGADRKLREGLMGDHFLCQNANKRSIVVDLKTERGRAIARRLAAAADVVVENYRTGVVGRLRMGYDDVRRLNPRVIYCSLKALGESGPMGGQAGWDNTVQALAGLMAATGTARTAPTKVGSPVVDYASGAMAAFAIAGALFQREKTGEGQFIDVSMLDAALLLMSPMITSYLYTGRPPQPHGNDHALAAGSCYPTKDGTLLMLGAISQRQFAAFCRAVGRPDLLADSRFANVRNQDPHRAALAAELAALLATRTAREWEALLADIVPASRVRSLDETLSLEQLKHRGVLHTLDAVPGADKEVTVPVAAFTFAHGGPHVDTPPPRLGEHTDEVLREVGYAADEIARLRRDKVVDGGGETK